MGVPGALCTEMMHHCGAGTHEAVAGACIACSRQAGL
jgi:hypothetical protein